MLCWMLLWLAAMPVHAAASHEDWVVIVDRWGNPLYQALVLERSERQLRGTLDGDRVEGEASGGHVRFVARDARGAEYAFEGTTGKRGTGQATMNGTATFPDPNDPGRRATHAFTARLLPARPPGPPRVSPRS